MWLFQHVSIISLHATRQCLFEAYFSLGKSHVIGLLFFKVHNLILKLIKSGVNIPIKCNLSKILLQIYCTIIKKLLNNITSTFNFVNYKLRHKVMKSPSHSYMIAQ